jgi:hypothetical protein
MGYIVIALMVLLAAVALGVSAGKATRKNGGGDTYVVASAEEGTGKGEKPEESSDDTASVQEAEVDTTKYLTRAEIERRLRVLAENPAPADLRIIGAMCYDVTSPTCATYVCPKCGERTLYSGRWTYIVWSTIPGCRRIVKTLAQIPIELDEAQFCKKCSPKIESPELCLLVRFKGEETHHRICNISLEDVTLLSEFLEGKDRHVHWNARESALKSHIDRLEEILNVELEPDSSGQEGESKDGR